MSIPTPLQRVLRQQLLPTAEYFREEFTKTQIYLHHTAGNADPFGVIRDWATDTRGRIATCVVIGGKGPHDGIVVQAFSSKFWAHHLGVRASVFSSYGLPNRNLDRTSIGIELCNWGWLTQSAQGFRNYVNRVVPDSEVYELPQPYKGYKFWHRYTPAQIDSTFHLLQHWASIYNIPLTYSDEIWGVTTKALRGQPGLYTHNSVRADKTDVHPQPELITMLKAL
jgi:N-acetyl-anhydromuramyl-L-alanine amidase AmpD